ncbi:MAG: M20/M25/M40 family metallo-hydrolase [Flavobacteriaceae bacterium]
MATISVTDSIHLSDDHQREFLLFAGLTPLSQTIGIKLVKIEGNEKATDVGMDRNDANGENELPLNKWKIIGSAKNFVISYEGKIDGKMSEAEENYQRGFSETPGVISDTGVYLAGSSYWIPSFKDQLITYSLTTELPSTWRTVSQGKRIMEETSNGKHMDSWLCETPQEEAFLIAAEFTEYSHNMNSGVKAMAFLRTPDEGLANKYLEVTEQYMQMYVSMLGDYPYTKFALVENFWETGYGMPSFTLLGEKIIRFPFILHSSYPHELLHNWWGNSVYVDFETGNWCEGLTVFMADHLIKEQRGAGDEYRRSTLQKFSNIITPENDFPLNQFISRHDGPSEAIGYGKSMMMWQMLRRKIGNENFIKSMKYFYETYKYKTASFTDIQHAVEEVTGGNYEAFFNQWVNRTGAPEIELQDVTVDSFADKFRVHFSLEQKQNEAIYNLDIPINIATEEGSESFVFNMNQRVQSFQISLTSAPLKLEVDPQYDVFRILNPSEVPPTLTKIWGSDTNVFIIPSQADKQQKAIYQKFAEDWITSDNDDFTIISDSDIKELPKNATAWILGFENKFSQDIEEQINAYQSSFNSDHVTLDSKNLSKKEHSFILTVFNKKNINKQLLFVAIPNKEAVSGLIRKLPHYGKYSYLSFKGNEPTNIAKGQWSVLNSPMSYLFDDKGKSLSTKENREALANLKPVFSEKRMMNSIKYLASEELKGRGLGTPELDQAAEYISKQFEEAGLQKLEESYYQKFSHTFKDKGELTMQNVIGILPGTDPELKDETVVISAHYDHLGLGWPDVRSGNENKIHYGADDNASGVAILMELAKSMAKTVKPKRTIVFLACTAEEAGLIGSRYYVAHQQDYFKGKIFANVNLDTDGSLFDKKLMVLNANTAKEWKFIFMGTDYTTGVKSEVIEQELDASDQVAFIENGIPAVQLFSGATQHYHRPSDTFETIDGPGLVKVAIVSKEVLLYLADREDPMLFTGKNAKERTETTKPSATKTKRRVSTGSVPDFAFKGPGIKIASVMEDSAGEKAGLKADDIILDIDGKEALNLKTYSDILKTYQPGDSVLLNILRGDEKKSIALTLGVR